MKKQEDLPCGEAGQTLLEVLLAFSVSILVLGSIILSVTTSLSNTQYTKNQGLANSYAREGVEMVRQIRDSSWANFKSMAGVSCLNKDLNWLPTAPPCGENVGIFSRQITINDSSDCLGGDMLTPPAAPPAVTPSGRQVVVAVSWSDNKCPAGESNPYCHKVELITCFSNIDQKEGP